MAETRVVRLRCGAVLLLQPRGDVRTVASGWHVRAGSWDEIPAWNGAAHLLEHLAFKGDGRSGAPSPTALLDRVGADANAFTGEDRTGFHATALAEHGAAVDEALARLLQPALRPEDVDLERSVVLEEIAMDADDPDRRALDLAAAYAHPDHPLGRPILGTDVTVGTMRPFTLAAFRDAAYVPERLVVSVAGRFDPGEVTDRVARWVDEWPVRSWGHRPQLPSRTLPPWRAGRWREVDPDLQRVHGASLAPGVPAAAPERYAAELLARVLGEPGIGRVHWTLVDTGLADAASLVHETGDGFGRFVATYEADPAHAEIVVERWREATTEMSPDDLDAGAWDRARASWASDVALDAETTDGAAAAAADAWTEREEAWSVHAEVARILATPLSAGQELLERDPFGAWCHATVEPAS